MLTLILKGTNGCNLNCAYCSLGEKTKHDLVDSTMLNQIFEYVCGVCQRRKENRLNIILHGGEPTLVPVTVYEAAIQGIRRKYPDVDVEVSMQTNGYSISDEYLAFFQRYDVNVGISIDGSAEIHNTERRSKTGKASYEKVIINMERLQAAGINVSGLMVLTSIGCFEPLDYLQYFASHHIHLKINPLLNYGEVYKNPQLAIKKGDYANYLIRAYEYIIENEMEVTVSPIDKFLSAVLNQKNISECTFNPDCNRNFICIDHLGDIYPCGKFSDVHTYKMGNVLNIDDDILENHQFRKLQERRTCKLPNKCESCRFAFLCHAGCSAEACIEKNINEPPYLCEDYQVLFEYFSEKGLLKLREQLMKEKRTLMEKLNGV
jgi:radical SAM additional 4Fe4S-binding domain